MSSSRSLLLAALATLGACASPPTQLIVVIDSDLRIGDEVDRIEIAVEDATGAETDMRVVDLATTSLPFSFGAVPRDASQPLRLEARALAPDGSVVVARRAVAPFASGRTARVVIRLDRACAGVACGPGETCVAGECADPAVAPEPIEPGRELDLDGGAPPDRPDAAPQCAAGECDPMLHVEVGDGFACALLATGRVACWGARNESGQLGNRTREPSPSTATIVDGVLAAEALGVGDAFGCAAGESGAWCWGDGSSGQLASGAPSSSDVAVPLTSTLGAPRLVYVGGRSACAVAGGAAQCWGEALAGTAGTYGNACGDRACALSPVDEPALGAAAEIAASTHTCVRIDLSLACAGANDDGQLGDGTREPRSSLVPVDAGVVWGFATSSRSTCALVGDEEGTAVRCWGAGELGQLGAAAPDACGAIACALHPIDAALSGATILELAAVDDTFCARMGDRRVLCWGSDADGALGDGPGAPESCGSVPCAAAPRPVLGLTDAIDLDGAAGTFCAVRSDGTAVCWGRGHGDAPVAAPVVR